MYQFPRHWGHSAEQDGGDPCTPPGVKGMCGGGVRTIDKQALILSLGGGPSYTQCSEMEGGRKGGK